MVLGGPSSLSQRDSYILMDTTHSWTKKEEEEKLDELFPACVYVINNHLSLWHSLKCKLLDSRHQLWSPSWSITKWSHSSDSLIMECNSRLPPHRDSQWSTGGVAFLLRGSSWPQGWTLVSPHSRLSFNLWVHQGIQHKGIYIFLNNQHSWNAYYLVCVCVSSLASCLTLCDPWTLYQVLDPWSSQEKLEWIPFPSKGEDILNPTSCSCMSGRFTAER